MQASHLPIAQRHPSSPFHPTSSGRCCSKDCGCHSRSLKPLCERCQAPLDMFGHHWGSCARSGRVKRRATPTKRMTARVFREAGACVRQNAFLRDMNVNGPAQDSRNIEVLAQGLPCHGGVQLAVDITLRSALSCDGQAHPHAADHDGAVLLQARRDKETISGTCVFRPLEARCSRD